mgnify:CR=1 FL=1
MRDNRAREMTCHQSIDEIRRGILQLRSHVAWLRFMQAFDRAAKANFNPAQPGIPAGHRFGGRWTDGSGPTGGPAKVILVGGRGGRRRGGEALVGACWRRWGRGAAWRRKPFDLLCS